MIVQIRKYTTNSTLHVWLYSFQMKRWNILESLAQSHLVLGEQIRCSLSVKNKMYKGRPTHLGRASMMNILWLWALASMMCCMYASSSRLLFPLTPTSGWAQRVMVAWLSGWIQLRTCRHIHGVNWMHKTLNKYKKTFTTVLYRLSIHMQLLKVIKIRQALNQTSLKVGFKSSLNPKLIAEKWVTLNSTHEYKHNRCTWF